MGVTASTILRYENGSIDNTKKMVLEGLSEALHVSVEWLSLIHISGQSVAQISTKIPNEIIAGIIYWLLLILVVGICVAGTGILAILIEIRL